MLVLSIPDKDICKPTVYAIYLYTYDSHLQVQGIYSNG